MMQRLREPEADGGRVSDPSLNRLRVIAWESGPSESTFAQPWPLRSITARSSGRSMASSASWSIWRAFTAQHEQVIRIGHDEVTLVSRIESRPGYGGFELRGIELGARID